ncbi:polycystin-2-like [Ruditapes philippinarum]|uniref:polycystin-2-like n=1 Tax=Ruditapes philippinarum TaxID=129788 RepID=UPI00295AB0BF|nr:polycystin-2-like [Ruditapes philippinarum]
MAVVFAMLFRKMSSPSTLITRSHVIKYFSTSSRKKCDATRMTVSNFDTTQLKEAQVKNSEDKKSLNNLYDCISTTVLIWILVSISYSSRDSRSYELYQYIENTFVKPSGMASFSKIQTSTDFYTWLNNTAIMKSFPETNIDSGNTPLHWRERQHIEGGHLFRVGPPRLRQLRIRKGTCHYSYIGTIDCYKTYRSASEDTGSYCFKWSKEKCSQKDALYNYSSPAWTHTSSFDIWGLPTVGHFATYTGGGYIAKLNVNRQVSQKIITELYRNIWIDRETRAVLFEFTLYSPNTNIFTYCIFMVEFPETGGAVPTYSVFPLRVYLHLGPSGVYTLVCEISYVVYLFLFSLHLVHKLLKERRTFFKDTWQIYDLFSAIGGYVTIAMVIVQMVFANKSLDVFRVDKKEFVNFQHIAIWNQVVVMSIGILVFMAILRLLKIFGYTQRIKVLANVFSKAAKDLISFAAFFIFTFISYAALGYLLFGSDIKAYQNVVKAMETLFISILGKSRFSEVEESDPVMAKVYFMLFVSGVVYLMMTIFFAILCAAIDEAHKICSNDSGSELVNNILNKLRRFIGLGNNRSSTEVTPIALIQNPKEVSSNIKTDDYKDAREVLVDIRSFICEAMMLNQRDFTTPSDEKHMKKVRFRC